MIPCKSNYKWGTLNIYWYLWHCLQFQNDVLDNTTCFHWAPLSCLWLPASRPSIWDHTACSVMWQIWEDGNDSWWEEFQISAQINKFYIWTLVELFSQIRKNVVVWHFVEFHVPFHMTGMRVGNETVKTSPCSYPLLLPPWNHTRIQDVSSRLGSYPQLSHW